MAVQPSAGGEWAYDTTTDGTQAGRAASQEKSQKNHCPLFVPLNQHPTIAQRYAVRIQTKQRRRNAQMIDEKFRCVKRE